MHREVFEAARTGSDRRGDARGDGGGSAALHRPAAPGGRHGVPVRARRARPGAHKWDRRPLRSSTSRRPSDGGRPVSPTSGGTASTGTTTTSRARCRASVTTASTGSSRPGSSAVLHLHRGTPYIYQGEEARHDQRAVCGPGVVPRHRVGQLLRHGRGARPGRRGGARGAARGQPRQRRSPSSGTAPRTPEFTSR